MRGSLGFEEDLVRQVGQDDMASLIEEVMPGQKMISLAGWIDFSMPQCPSWILVSILGRSVVGMKILFPFKMMLSVTDSSSLKFQNVRVLGWHEILDSGHPDCIYAVRCCSCGSSLVACRISSAF